MRRLTPLLLLLAACSPAPAGEEESPGSLLYRRQGCSQCHSPAGTGTSLAPALVRLGDKWTRADLAAYLAHPGPFLESRPHLAELTKRYGATMPSSGHLTEPERLSLADYLIELSEAD